MKEPEPRPEDLDISLEELNRKRQPGYRKDAEAEAFLHNMNRALQVLEAPLCQNYPIEHPFIFIFGLPRSGTTLISQLLAHGLKVSYINNLAARFWLAPIHGIRLARNVLGEEKQISFRSNYARTGPPGDIHEFGYFWRYWLKKETLADVVFVKEREEQIDWKGLRRVLSTIQREFDKPWVAKNVLGAYHVEKLKHVLGKVLFVYIERDPLDVAVSILEARKKYYTDPNTWWSYTPVEFHLLKDLDYWHQIGGQIYFLRRYYNRQIAAIGEANVVRVHYEQMCRHPASVLQQVQERLEQQFGYELPCDLEPPEAFPLRHYESRNEEKQRFAKIIEAFHRTYD